MKYYSMHSETTLSTSTLIYIIQTPIILMAGETLKAISGANKKKKERGIGRPREEKWTYGAKLPVYLRSVAR